MAQRDNPEVDLPALRAFVVLAEAGSFANAQAVLQVSQSTISERLSRLEGTVGMTLCERGRRGFRLTQEGHDLRRAADRLLAAVEDFRLSSSELGTRLSGRLSVAIVDNTISDPACPIIRAIEEFDARDHDVEIDLWVGGIEEVEKRILDGSFELGVSNPPKKGTGISFRHLYHEDHILCCGRNHPLQDAGDEMSLASQLQHARFAVPHNLAAKALGSFESDKPPVLTDTVEACAILLLSGGYIGYLPAHFAAGWIASGRLRQLRPERHLRFPIGVLTAAAGVRSRAAKHFSSHLRAAEGEYERDES